MHAKRARPSSYPRSRNPGRFAIGKCQKRSVSVIENRERVKATT